MIKLKKESLKIIETSHKEEKNNTKVKKLEKYDSNIHSTYSLNFLICIKEVCNIEKINTTDISKEYYYIKDIDDLENNNKLY